MRIRWQSFRSNQKQKTIVSILKLVEANIKISFDCFHSLNRLCGGAKMEMKWRYLAKVVCNFHRFLSYYLWEISSLNLTYGRMWRMYAAIESIFFVSFFNQWNYSYNTNAWRENVPLQSGRKAHFNWKIWLK